MNNDGTGSICVYGNKFEDETLKLNIINQPILILTDIDGSQFLLTRMSAFR